jgi:hypothetical protein
LGPILSDLPCLSEILDVLTKELPCKVNAQRISDAIRMLTWHNKLNREFDNNLRFFLESAFRDSPSSFPLNSLNFPDFLESFGKIKPEDFESFMGDLEGFAVVKKSFGSAFYAAVEIPTEKRKAILYSVQRLNKVWKDFPIVSTDCIKLLSTMDPASYNEVISTALTFLNLKQRDIWSEFNLLKTTGELAPFLHDLKKISAESKVELRDLISIIRFNGVHKISQNSLALIAKILPLFKENERYEVFRNLTKIKDKEAFSRLAQIADNPILYSLAYVMPAILTQEIDKILKEKNI